MRVDLREVLQSRRGRVLTARFAPTGLVSFVFNLGGGIIAPALPLYARALGADYRDLGLIGASHGLAFAALTIPLGRASDRFGRRALLLLSAVAVGAAAACYLLSTHVLGLAAAKFLEAVGWAAFWPALQAWVAERSSGRAGAAMGVAYGAYAAAFVIGTSAAGFVIEALGLRAPFAIYLGTAAAAIVLIPALTSTRTADGHGPETTAPVLHAAPADRHQARAFRLLAYGTGFVYVFGLGTVLAFLPAYAADRGLSSRAVGFLVSSYWLSRVMGSLVAGRLSDRLGRRAILLPAMLVTAVGGSLLAIPIGPNTLVMGSVGLGLAAGACAPTCIGLIADNVSAADRGIAMGLFEASCGVSILAAGLVGGFSAEALGAGTPYLLVTLLALGWMVVLALRLRPSPRG